MIAVAQFYRERRGEETDEERNLQMLADTSVAASIKEESVSEEDDDDEDDESEAQANV